jgi:imidazolonepropionase-like amidohydrolase
MSSLTVTTVEEARATTLRLIDDGADLVKIALEGGATFGQEIAVLTSDQAAAIVRAAHERGKRVSVHITAAEDIARCLDAGVDDIAHMPSDAVSAGQAKRVAAAGIYWVPTLELWHNVQPPLGQRAIANLRRFIEAGGLVALGTDYGGYDAEFDLGLPLREMEWMLEAGMTPAQVIQAATRNAAVVCGFGSELGTIEPGKIADVLVVQGDPLTDLYALSRVRWVLHNGVVIREPE